MKPFEILTGNLKLEEKEVKGQKKQYIKGLITTNDKDLVNDIVTQKCMDSMTKQIKDRTLKLDFEHETFSGETEQEMEINKTKIPLGKRVDWQRKKDGIEVEWELNPTWKQINSKGEVLTTYNDVVYNIKNGFYDGFSIAYYPTQTDTKNVKGEEIRLLDDVNLLNIALTGNPVNQEASLTEIMAKSRDFLKNKEKPEQKDHSAKWHRCVDKVKEQSSNVDPYAVCTAALGKESFKSYSNHNEPERSSESKLKNKEGKMAEETENSEKPQTEKPQEKTSKEETQEKPEEKSEVAEVKSEIKSLKEDNESLKKELGEIKSLIKQPQRKSVQEGKSEQKEEEKAGNSEPSRPLDLIR